MIFRRILALVACCAALLAAACTAGENPLATAAAGPTSAPPLPREIEREVGPAYQSPRLQEMVDSVGRNLVSRAGLPGNFRFYILDEPAPNAHAMGAGYVFVTRGLLALIDDEAELAAAIGHELGHISLHHAAERERERRVVMAAAIKAATTSGSITVGRSVAREGMIESLERLSATLTPIDGALANEGLLLQAGRGR